ncbi:MAG TPA: zinc finger MYND domain-containing protein [Elusimicrobiota bacterium]|nr:zinc finger MYND domain-containing protein [Elusimicrobiota bacterium]
MLDSHHRSGGWTGSRLQRAEEIFGAQRALPVGGQSAPLAEPSPVEGQDTHGAGRTTLVGDQGGRGCGLAAGQAFAPGDLVCEFGPRYFTPEKARAATKADWAPVVERFDHAYFAHSGAVYVGDATDYRSGCLVNDFAPPALILRLAACRHALAVASWRLQYTKAAGLSAAINVGLREAEGRLRVVALRRIRAGEPLLAAYGPAFWVERALLDRETPAAHAALLAYYLAEVATRESDFRPLPLVLRQAGVFHVCVPMKRELKGDGGVIWFDGRPPSSGGRVEALRALGRLWPEASDLGRWLELASAQGAPECLQVRRFAPAEAVRADWDLPAAHACVVCGAAKPKRCSHCRASLYCGPPCAAADRGVHRETCAALPAEVAALRAAAGLPARAGPG